MVERMIGLAKPDTRIVVPDRPLQNLVSVHQLRLPIPELLFRPHVLLFKDPLRVDLDDRIAICHDN